MKKRERESECRVVCMCVCVCVCEWVDGWVESPMFPLGPIKILWLIQLISSSPPRGLVAFLYQCVASWGVHVTSTSQDEKCLKNHSCTLLNSVEALLHENKL